MKKNQKQSQMKKNVTNKKQNSVTDSCTSKKAKNIGFEAKDHSFEYDENDEHSFELRDCK